MTSSATALLETMRIREDSYNDAKVRKMPFIVELPPGAEWTPHPSGDGIIVADPDHPLRWIRLDRSIVVTAHLIPDM